MLFAIPNAIPNGKDTLEFSSSSQILNASLIISVDFLSNL